MSLDQVSPRRYTCLACADTTTAFQTECPSCGGTAFETGTDTDDRAPTPVERIAHATAPLNPYVPR